MLRLLNKSTLLLIKMKILNTSRNNTATEPLLLRMPNLLVVSILNLVVNTLPFFTVRVSKVGNTLLLPPTLLLRITEVHQLP